MNKQKLLHLNFRRDQIHHSNLTSELIKLYEHIKNHSMYIFEEWTKN